VRKIHTRFFPDAKGLLRYDIFYLFMLFVVVGVVWGGLKIGDLAGGSIIQEFDRWTLTAVRSAENPVIMRGPAWLPDLVRDITALGGAPVLTVVVLAVVGYLVLQKSYRSTLLVLIATLSGLLLSMLLKFYFFRSRPDIVPHLMYETTPSFPSGHSMMSAVVYLTLASLLARIETSNRVRLYTVGVATSIVVLVGISRVFLGVHYPSDVLAGWTFGTGWAMICWYFARYLQNKGAIEEVQD
jgi:undecaprenyl-diphosphatase